MSDGICDICGKKPATVRVQAHVNGRRRTLELCDEDYEKLRARQHGAARSPFESLFSNHPLMSGMMGNLWQGADGDNDFHLGPRSPRETVNVVDVLSERAKEMLQEAARHAQERGRGDVDTENLLYALADTDVVQAILEQVKVSPADLRRYIDENAPRGDATDKEPQEMGVTPRVKDALSRALAAARDMGHSYVGPEHLLVGLAEEGEGFAAEILKKYGLTPHALRQQIAKVVGKGAESGEVDRPSDTPELDKVARDLTKLARDGKLDPVIGRAREIETTIEVLARRKKNNPVLIGEPGVGKTAIVEGLAQRIIAGEVPETLRDKRLVELNVNALVAGSKYRGEFEERVQNVLDEVESASDSMILFIDEVHTIVGAGANEGGLDVANTFKPAMARGELNLIGATTLNEYQKHIEKDAALERRFQPVMVPEPSVDQTVMILRGLRDTFEAHHKVVISDPAVTAAAELSDRYITGRFLPDKAIDLLDQAAARVRMATTSRPPEVQESEAEFRQLDRELDYAKTRKDEDRQKDIESRRDAARKRLDDAEEAWRSDRRSRSDEVRIEDIADIVAKLTGIPVSELTSEERTKLMQMEDTLHNRVIGQDEAVKAVSDAVRLARAGLREGARPIASFLFLGPTGVGKTELAKALASSVFGDEDAIIRIDMSEYMEKHTVARLIGAPPGYVGYDEGGQLTERVRRKPYSVVLLDEIEKAHGDVANVLLQVFDDGRLTDGKGRVIDFTNTIIIATSNLGADLIQAEMKRRGTADADDGRLKRDLMDVLRGHFRPEFINRIDEVIVFHALDRKQIRSIVELQLERVKHMALGQGVTLEFDDRAIERLANEGYKPEFGARELRRLIRSSVETILARKMLDDEVHEGDKVKVTVADGQLELNVEKAAKPEETGPQAPSDGKQAGPSTEPSPPDKAQTSDNAIAAEEGADETAVDEAAAAEATLAMKPMDAKTAKRGRASKNGTASKGSG
ncbi:ATP-dependent Clp protease ATP-binding subunit [Paracoccus saliphilus]|uniref:ATP-dependent Clp protease ATP-binding subunit n=1 Tax=Paracoccus saliphilus TaxID=405559 RepID=A0AA45W7H0_9RHOB|nr:ATP-dependent Clp protease ATP-binding subunit [Paracoccus saliphilus]WCR02702.1 ATP-dependent Clp protease ATP-binding subunit [Paracoccus saliphilus]SIT09514.1 ATP-dependent Clp protease ATP-binding subunit ClpC [Paracoccus saliphilus]